MGIKKKNLSVAVRTRNDPVGTRKFPTLTRKYCMCTGYTPRTGDHSVHFGLLCFCVEMTVQELAELYFDLGLHYKDTHS